MRFHHQKWLKWTRMFLIAGVLLTSLFNATTVLAAGEARAHADFTQLDRGWSAVKANVPPGADAPEPWQSLDNLSALGLSEQNAAYPLITYKIKLPQVDCKDCVLSIARFIRAYDVYLDGVKITSSKGGTAIQPLEMGKPDQIIDLPEQSQGKELRVIANISHRSSPMYAPVYYGDKESIIQHLLDLDKTQIVISMLVLMTGFISGMLFLSLKRDTAFLWLGLCAINIGMYMLGNTASVHYLTIYNYFWDFTEYFLLYSMPLTTWLYFRNFVKSKKIIHWGLVALNGGFLLFTIIQHVTGTPLIEYVAQQRLVFLISLAVIITELIRSARGGNREAKMVVSAFIITCIITTSKLLALVFNTDLDFLTPFAGGFFMLSQLFVMTDRFRRMNEELSIHSKNLERINEITETEVRNRTKQVRTLMDNVAQGFLTVGPDLIVEKEFSKACIKLLGYEPAGKHVIEMLAPDDPQKAAWIERMFNDLFQTVEQFKIDMYVQLLPNEMTHGDRTLGISMEVVRQGDQKPEHIILMFNDLTKQRALEEKLKNEEKLMRMVVTVLSRSRDYADIVEDYHQFVNKELPFLLDNLHSELSPDVLVLRMVHTFKGNFAQMNSFILAPHLHEIENKIKRLEIESLENWADRVRTFEWKKPLEDEQRRMFDILPQQHWNDNKDAIPVPRNTLLNLRDYIIENLPPEMAANLVKEVERLYQKSFASLFEPVAENTTQLAERLNKLVEPVSIEGGEWFTDLEPWHEWAKSLVHVTRNQIDHGIEDPDVRIDNGKEVYGKIKIAIQQDLSKLTITFSDDGAGINTKKLRSKLIGANMISEKQAASMSDEELYPFLFMDSVSTRDNVSELSGRGVGLAKVLEETEKLSGSIHVESEYTVGTKFTFVFPMRDGLPLITADSKEIA